MEVRVLLYSTYPRDACLEFELIFPDYCQKHYKFSDYEIKSFRMSERDIIENCARDYFNDIGESFDAIYLIFL